MSDREIINAKQCIPMWWKPNIAFLKEEWINHPDLSKFRNKKPTQRNCNCNNPRLVNLWNHDSCVRGRIDTDVCVNCNEVKSFKIIR